MSDRTAAGIAEQMLDLLPPDGAPVLNRVLRAMLSQHLAQPVSTEDFFFARDLLLKRGRVGRERGQGGKIFLLKTPPAVPVAPAVALASPTAPLEAELMAPVARYLSTIFVRNLDLPKGALALMQDISAIGPSSGQWAQPDFMLVSLMRFTFMPGSQLDVHAFELKTEAGGSIQAVHEALAQTHFTHFGHLIWHLPEESRARARLPDVQKQCEEHGIGLILSVRPQDLESYEILLDPKRKATPPKTVDGFLESRLNPHNRAALKKALKEDA
ncbi:hypothetical protein V5G24_11620 [Xanthobacter sp. VTT E-85241]|uniref:hypothetical protein n=1 Tax=Roseixanthobacter finlandensis TaxID=3119922 RepID=UPI00372995EE